MRKKLRFIQNVGFAASLVGVYIIDVSHLGCVVLMTLGGLMMYKGWEMEESYCKSRKRKRISTTDQS